MKQPTATPSKVFGLSEREGQVLIFIWQGLTEAEMAAELGLGIPTVRQYKARLQVKVGASRPSEIIRCAIEGLPHVSSPLL